VPDIVAQPQDRRDDSSGWAGICRDASGQCLHEQPAPGRDRDLPLPGNDARRKHVRPPGVRPSPQLPALHRANLKGVNDYNSGKMIFPSGDCSGRLGDPAGAYHHALEARDLILDLYFGPARVTLRDPWRY